MPVLRTVKFGVLLREENLNAKGKRITIDQHQLDKAKANLQANPDLQSQQGAKFVKSLTQKGYNKKQDIKTDGQKAGAHNVGETEGTDIDFGAGKTTVSRFNQLPANSPSRKAFGGLVGDIKRRVDSTANVSKSSAPQVKPVKPVAPVTKTAKKTDYNAPKPNVNGISK